MSNYDGRCAHCGHSMLDMLGIKVHHNIKSGVISKKCTKCNCENPSIDDSGDSNRWRGIEP